LAERNNLINLEALGFKVNEVVLVAKEYLSLNAPVVVDEVRVVEVHAPPLALWRKTAKEQYLGVTWQKGNERMVFHAILAAGYVFFVQI
jgi:hypothetical protein